MEIINKKALFEYFILDSFNCGIILTGVEVKSIRTRNPNFVDSHCTIENGEIFLHNFNIEQYKFSRFEEHDPKRKRKLLLNKWEINRIHSKVKEKGITIIPTKLFTNKNNLIKIEISLCKGKKIYDKREAIKKKEMQRKGYAEI